jgi:hypothetical protein
LQIIWSQRQNENQELNIANQENEENQTIQVCAIL